MAKRRQFSAGHGKKEWGSRGAGAAHEPEAVQTDPRCPEAWPSLRTELYL